MQMKSPPPPNLNSLMNFPLNRLQTLITNHYMSNNGLWIPSAGPRDINNYYNRGYQRVIGTSHHLFTTFSSVFRYSQGCRANIILGHTSHYWRLSMVMVYKVDFYEILHPSRKRTPKSSSVHIEYWVCVFVRF